MPNQNGRNMNDNREQRSWRPQDDDRMTRDRGEREHRDRDDDNTERFGGGQSGYGSGRFGDDRSMGPGYRNQSQPNRSNFEDRQGMNTDDRFSGRGGEGYWEDRTERSGYNSGYNQGGMGYGSHGGGMQQRSSQQAFRGNGAQSSANEYNQGGRYPDMYGPDDNYGAQGARQNGRYGQGGNYQQADFEHGVGYGQGTGGRWANVPQAGMQQDYGRGYPQQRGGMQGGGMGGMQGGGMGGMQGGMQGGMGGMGMQGGGMGGMQGNYGPDMQRNYGGYGGSGTQGNMGQPGGGNYGQRYEGYGGHRGKGPQGYTRSDDRIKETVCEALHDDDHVDASHIEVVVKNGEVILTGNVDDRRQKRLAEDLVERLPGVKDVQNQLRCGSGERRGNQNTGSAVGKNETEMTSDKKHRA